ncbi:cgi-62, putative [Ixodes scapularis]|uniref:Cgi-62, putative n=1 Tax=Ixodes scapularis TaxID=6945 RepID=B7PW96_IXOSC|nr:cgi-62, putative [Ixodes scapularis]|eukprot:XP_002409510.1 cgi-62, putative [Ixodes scapularis]
MDDVGYVECPTCNRNFSDRAADRHIAWCQERNNRIPPKSPASAEAVERLKARTKYKVPTPGKKNGTVSPSGSHGSKELAYKTVASKAVAGNHKRTKSSPSMLEANGTSTGHPKKAAVKYTDDGYDPYKKADLQMRELIRGTTLAPKNPRTVPGVRTQGLHNNTSSNTSDSNSYTSTNSSGSDGSLLGYGSTGCGAPESKVPYLCHQCGTVYPVSAAKFCYECGARRLGLIALYGQ